ncbi:hypothetical protein ABMX86_21880 [Vibrio vulnificus]|uniref:hypothetical protein n=1 Tax=Vibrio TaxID=662 RepID=UPI0020CD4BC1|nr:hypothetical protein [Vibrio aestuarianus]MDE1312602.1 hypothetical protein [Vibrio aestuarianus]
MQEFLAYLGGSSVIVGFLSWLFRKTIERVLSEYISSKAKRHNYVFEQIHTRKIESISKLYEASVLASDATAYVVGMQGNLEQERVESLELDVKNFAKQYKLAKLWLSDDLCNLIDQLLVQHSAFYKVVTGYRLRQSGLGKTLDEKMLDLWAQADEKLPLIQKKLSEAFKAELAKISP